MARIRTIKPGFFTSDDICALSPLARLLFIGLWCEADREGRLEWKPRTFKRSYLPDDNCDADAIAGELVKQGVIILYGQGLAYIPSFRKHQIVNARESASKLPDPHVQEQAQPMQEHAEAGEYMDMSVHAPTNTVGKGKEEEGKGREVRENLTVERGAPAVADAAPVDLDIPDFLKRASNAKTGGCVAAAVAVDQSQPVANDAGRNGKAGRAELGSRLPDDWQPNDEQRAFCAAQGLDPDVTARRFRNHWHAKPGKDARKTRWNATWENWCTNPIEKRINGGGKPSWEKAHEAEIDAIIARGEGGSA